MHRRGAGHMSSPSSAPLEEGGIASRTYTAVFHEVWVAILGAAGALRGWSVDASDSREGTVTLLAADLFGRSPAVLEVRLSLDEVGLTRLDVRAAAMEGAEQKRDLRRARRLLRRVDRLLLEPPHR